MSLVVSSVWPALPTRAAFPACFTASNFCFLPLRACLLPGLSKPTGQASPPPPARTAAAQKPKHGERPHTICAASWRNAGQAGGRAKWLRSNWVSEQRLVQRRGQTLRKSSCGRGTKRRRRRSICIMQAAGMMERGHRSARPPRKRARPFISRVPFATTGIATHAAPSGATEACLLPSSRLLSRAPSRRGHRHQGQREASPGTGCCGDFVGHPRSQGHRAGAEGGGQQRLPHAVSGHRVRASGHPLAVRPRDST